MNSKLSLLLTITFIALVFSVFTGCITTYKRTTLEKLPLDRERHTIEGSDVQISLLYDVLTGPGTKQYSKMEKKNKVSLVMLTIQNSGTQELLVDRDLEFRTSEGYTIQPLTLEEAGEALVKPVVVQIEPPSCWITDVTRLVNDSKKVISHIRFTKDMLEYYLEGQVVAPGSCQQGLFAFPVVKGTPLQIAVR